MTIGRFVSQAAVLVSLAATAGCATMANGRSQEVRVYSTPSGATVWLNGQPAGTTPTTLRVRRTATVDLRMEKPGFATTTLRVPRCVSGWITLNGLILNPYPAAQGLNSTGEWALGAVAWFAAFMATDRLSGGMFVRPRFVEATLAPLDPPPDAAAARTDATTPRTASGTPSPPSSSCR